MKLDDKNDRKVSNPLLADCYPVLCEEVVDDRRRVEWHQTTGKVILQEDFATDWECKTFRKWLEREADWRENKRNDPNRNDPQFMEMARSLAALLHPYRREMKKPSQRAIFGTRETARPVPQRQPSLIRLGPSEDEIHSAMAALPSPRRVSSTDNIGSKIRNDSTQSTGSTLSYVPINSQRYRIDPPARQKRKVRIYDVSAPWSGK